jgi:hypothetical protein
MILSLWTALWLLFAPSQAPALRFEVRVEQAVGPGRVFVVLAKTPAPEPRELIGETGSNAPPVLARDVQHFGPGDVAVIDEGAAMFPIQTLNAVPEDDYYIQAVFAANPDLRSADAPGNRYSSVQRVHLRPRKGGVVELHLSHVIPPEQLSSQDEHVQYVTIRSDLLSRFHKRPIYLRAGVILPRDYAVQRDQKYPLRIHIGGYGTRFTSVERLMSVNSEFRRVWRNPNAPSMVYLQLDGAGPYGDPYQVNSDNNGPYGDALIHELIPYVEKKFRAIAQPHARLLDGESTGGWVSLALKIFYPDFFNAVWASCPDGLDFRAFQVINIYQDKNAYFDERGNERPSKRDLRGNVEFTIRHECQMENVLGQGDSWTMSGRQWGAWNATYGPRGADGRPVPLWDPKSGEINHAVVNHWKRYDLRLVLQQNWSKLAPKLRGKIHIAVGEADSYYLNNAVHLLDEFLNHAEPSADARIVYGAGRGHCWSNLTEEQLIEEMNAAVQKPEIR